MAKKIFISHSALDKQIVDYFVGDLLQGACSIANDEIFCTSLEGTRIESGEDWRAKIMEAFNAEITILIITPNYKESEICLNEMGGAWVKSQKVIPLIVEPINYRSIGVILEPKQIDKFCDSKNLDHVKDVIQKKLKIPIDKIPTDKWNKQKKEFIIKVKKYLRENPFKNPIERTVFDEALQNIKDLESLIEDKMKEITFQKEIIESLKKTKDAKEVSAVMSQYTDDSLFDQFWKLCEEAASLLGELSNIVVGKVFSDFNEANLAFSYFNYKSEMTDAIARKLIDKSDYSINWGSTTMWKIRQSLNKIRDFISTYEQDNVFLETFSSNYNCDLEIDNIEFWREVLDIYPVFE